MQAWGAVDLRIYLAQQNHGYSISAQSYEFHLHLTQLDILEFTLSHKSSCFAGHLSYPSLTFHIASCTALAFTALQRISARWCRTLVRVRLLAL